MLIRVSSRQGVTRIEVEATETVAVLMKKIEAALGIAQAAQHLSVRNAANNNTTVPLTPNSATLQQLHIRHGDMIYLVSPETTMTTSEIEAEKVKAQQTAAALNGSSSSSSSSSASAPPATGTARAVKEDDIDEFLRRQDGWTKRSRSRYCTHGINGSCGHCMPIAPWAITNHEEFAELNLKHIPYHAWLREKQYRNANNPVTVEDPSYRTEIKLHEAGPALSSKENMSVTLERQVFRHVDYVEFDNPAVVDKFIEGWRQSGKQRCGYMLGRYVPDKDIPLGIRAVVSAIYEPPQNSTREGVQLLRDADDAAVDQLLEKLGGLRRIGFIWTSVSVDMQRKIVPDRDWDTVHLKSAECFRMGQFQNKYPSPSKESNTGVFGSKFVSVLVFGKEDGNIDLGAFQLSNQVCRLIRDGVVRTSKQPQSLHVRPSKDNVVHPDVFFREKNEYGFMVTKKAEPDFPNDYGLVSLRYGFPRDISPLFSRTLDFPIANRSPTVSAQQTPSSLKTLLQNQHGRSFLDKLNDFHVLLYIQKNVQRDLFDKILQAILSPNQGVNEQHIRPLLEAQLLNKAAPASQSQSTVSSSSSSSSSSTSTPNQTSTANATAATPSQEMMEQLLLMGYGEDQAREALWATNNVSVEAALEFLLSRI